jgi:hypothetical protein
MGAGTSNGLRPAWGFHAACRAARDVLSCLSVKSLILAPLACIVLAACGSGGGSTSTSATGGSAAGASASAGASSGASAAASSSAGSGSSGTATGIGSTGGTATGSTGGTPATSGTTTGRPGCQLATSNPLYIDGAAGVDSPCCGASLATACRTLTQAMGNVVADANTGFPDGVLVHVLEASMSAGGPNWAAPETWPVTLTWGVTLHGPGLYFANQGSSASDLFHAQRYSGNDTQHVTIHGDAANPVHIGYANDGDSSKTLTALEVSSGLLDLEDAVLDGTTALLVHGAYVQLGPDPIQIGSLADGVTGQLGVVCYDGGQLNDNGGAVAGPPLLAIEGQATADLTVGLQSNLELTNGGRFGPELVGGVCPTKVDTLGIDVRGGTVQASHVIIQCQNGDGILSEALPGGFIDFDGTVQHNGCAGIRVLGHNSVQPGTAIAPTVITANHYGIIADGDGGIVSLGINDHVTVACESATEPGNCASDGPAIDLWQQGSGTILASGVTWQEAPVIFDCNATLSACSWDAGSGALPSPAEAVVSGSGVISLTSPVVGGACP